MYDTLTMSCWNRRPNADEETTTEYLNHNTYQQNELLLSSWATWRYHLLFVWRISYTVTAVVTASTTHSTLTLSCSLAHSHKNTPALIKTIYYNCIYFNNANERKRRLLLESMRIYVNQISASHALIRKLVIAMNHIMYIAFLYTLEICKIKQCL